MEAAVLRVMDHVDAVRAEKSERVHLSFIESPTHKAMLAINFTEEIQLSLKPDQCAVYAWDK